MERVSENEEEIGEERMRESETRKTGNRKKERKKAMGIKKKKEREIRWRFVMISRSPWSAITAAGNYILIKCRPFMTDEAKLLFTKFGLNLSHTLNTR